MLSNLVNANFQPSKMKLVLNSLMLIACSGRRDICVGDRTEILNWALKYASFVKSDLADLVKIFFAYKDVFTCRICYANIHTVVVLV